MARMRLRNTRQERDEAVRSQSDSEVYLAAEEAASSAAERSAWIRVEDLERSLVDMEQKSRGALQQVREESLESEKKRSVELLAAAEQKLQKERRSC